MIIKNDKIVITKVEFVEKSEKVSAQGPEYVVNRQLVFYIENNTGKKCVVSYSDFEIVSDIITSVIQEAENLLVL